MPGLISVQIPDWLKSYCRQPPHSRVRMIIWIVMEDSESGAEDEITHCCRKLRANGCYLSPPLSSTKHAAFILDISAF